MDNKNISELTKKLLEETDDNIVGVSYGYKFTNGKLTNEMAISFYVKKKLSLSELNSAQIIPKTLEYSGETFTTDVVESEFSLFTGLVHFCYDEHYTWWDYYPIPPARTVPTNRNKLRPLKGGVSVTNYTSNPGSIGTLGFLAIDNEDGSIVGVSNNHVLINDAFIASERTNSTPVTNIKNNAVTQPHEVGDNGLANSIGIVKRYVSLRSTVSNKVDGALTTIDSGACSLTESWKQEGLTLSSALPFASTLEIDNLLATDSLLYSAGRTSGAKGELNTKLKVSALGASISIAYNKQGLSQVVGFTDCIIFIASGASTPAGDICFFPLAPGDSGSALIADISGTKKIIGLCFAGNVVYIPNPSNPPSGNVPVSYLGIACRIDHIASELNISAWNGSSVNFSDINNIQEHIVSGLDNNQSITYLGHEYWQAGLTYDGA